MRSCAYPISNTFGCGAGGSPLLMIRVVHILNDAVRNLACNRTCARCGDQEQLSVMISKQNECGFIPMVSFPNSDP